MCGVWKCTCLCVWMAFDMHNKKKKNKTKGGWLPQDRMQQTFQQHIYKMLQSINEHYEEMFICGVSLIQY